jgi:hypothetical protein
MLILAGGAAIAHFAVADAPLLCRVRDPTAWLGRQESNYRISNDGTATEQPDQLTVQIRRLDDFDMQRFESAAQAESLDEFRF